MSEDNSKVSFKVYEDVIVYAEQRLKDLWNILHKEYPPKNGYFYAINNEKIIQVPESKVWSDS